MTRHDVDAKAEALIAAAVALGDLEVGLRDAPPAVVAHTRDRVAQVRRSVAANLRALDRGLRARGPS